MFSTIISWLLSTLLFLFPFLSGLFPGQQTWQPLDNEAVAITVISAVKTRDVAALEDLMCLNIKQNTSDLTNEIEKLLDAIDGEQIEFSWLKRGGYQESNGKGKNISQNYLRIDIITSTEHYFLLIVLETYNSFAPKEMGIRSITLMTETDWNKVLYAIQATNGIIGWHD
jgi:hypothetical protein